MCRIACAVFAVCLVHCALSQVARSEDPAQQSLEGWGEFVDPSGDCRVTKQDHRVTMTIPGTHHNLNPTPKFDNTDGPRILQSVSGDFTAEVTVLPFPIPEKGTSNNRGGHSYVAAGLLVWQDDKSFARWFRAANGERSDVFASDELFDEGKFKSSYYHPNVKNRDRHIHNKALHLKVTRRGDELTYFRSLDGTTWEAFAIVPDCPLDAELKVGVGAVNSATREFSPQFSNFKLDDHDD